VNRCGWIGPEGIHTMLGNWRKGLLTPGIVEQCIKTVSGHKQVAWNTVS